MEGRDGIRTDQSMTRARPLQTLERTGGLLPGDALWINMDIVSRMNISNISTDSVPEAAVVEQLRNLLSADGVYKFGNNILA